LIHPDFFATVHDSHNVEPLFPLADAQALCLANGLDDIPLLHRLLEQSQPQSIPFQPEDGIDFHDGALCM
jgi:hypothetical protein